MLNPRHDAAIIGNDGSRPGRCEILQAEGKLFAMSQRSILFGWWPFDGWFIWRLVQAQIKPWFHMVQLYSIVSLFGVHVYLVSWWGFVERSMMVHRSTAGPGRKD